jgi:hypothetical protein
MKHNLVVLSVVLLGLVSLSTQQLPPVQEIPTFKIDLDLPPQERYNEVIAALKPQITKMFNEYLHLCPKFIREFFAEH